MYVSKSWRYLYFGSSLLAVAALSMVVSMPESPKFLISMKRFDEARKVFSLIGRKNLQS